MQVVGINTGGLGGGDSTAIVNQFLEQTGATFPVGWELGGASSYSQFRVSGGNSISPFPLDVVIDRDGVVRYVNREYEPAAMQAAIDAAL